MACTGRPEWDVIGASPSLGFVRVFPLPCRVCGFEGGVGSSTTDVRSTFNLRRNGRAGFHPSFSLEDLESLGRSSRVTCSMSGAEAAEGLRGSVRRIGTWAST